MKQIKLCNTIEGQRYNLTEIQRMLLSEEVDYNSNFDIEKNPEYECGRTFIQIWSEKTIIMLVCESTDLQQPVLFRNVFKQKLK